MSSFLVDILKNELKAEVDILKNKIERCFAILNNQIKLKIDSIQSKIVEQEKNFAVKSEENKIKILELSEENINSLQVNVLHRENEAFEIENYSIGTIYYSLNDDPVFQLSVKPLHCDLIPLDFLPRGILKLNNGLIVVIQMNTNLLHMHRTDFTKATYFAYTDQIFSITQDDSYIYVASRTSFIKLSFFFTIIAEKPFSDFAYLFDDDVKHICMHGCRLYAVVNTALLVLSNNFEFIQIMEIPNIRISKIFHIQILNDVICVSCFVSRKGSSILFLKLSDFELINSYSFLESVISVDKNFFWIFNERCIACFTSKGMPISIRKLEIGFPVNMIKDEKNLLICLQEKSDIAKVTIN